jgi:hypothetical protein
MHHRSKCMVNKRVKAPRWCSMLRWRRHGRKSNLYIRVKFRSFHVMENHFQWTSSAKFTMYEFTNAIDIDQCQRDIKYMSSSCITSVKITFPRRYINRDFNPRLKYFASGWTNRTIMLCIDKRCNRIISTPHGKGSCAP